MTGDPPLVSDLSSNNLIFFLIHAANEKKFVLVSRIESSNGCILQQPQIFHLTQIYVLTVGESRTLPTFNEEPLGN